jgi:hypothetical protein
VAKYVDKDKLELEIFKSIIDSIGENDFACAIGKAIGWLAIETASEIKETE